MNRFEYIAADSVEQAIAFLGEDWQSRILAGGTDLMHEIRHGIIAPARLVNIKGIPTLNTAIREENGSVVISALARLSELEQSALVRERLPLLAQAAAAAASPQLRNMGTIAGNICQRPRCWYYRHPEFPCLRKEGKRCFAVAGENRYHAVLGGGPCHIVCPSDMAPALVALDAQLRIAGNDSKKGKIERVVAIQDFFVGPRENLYRENILEPHELITEIRVLNADPENRPGDRSAIHAIFLKVRERNSWDFALASVAARLTFEGGVVRSSRIVFGGVAPVPWRSALAEKAIQGRTLEQSTCKEASDAAVSACRPMRGNAYKVDIIRNLVAKALASAAAGR